MDLKGFGGGADCLDFLLVITDGTDSNVFLLLLESDDTRLGYLVKAGARAVVENSKISGLKRYLQLWVI